MKTNSEKAAAAWKALRTGGSEPGDKFKVVDYANNGISSWKRACKCAIISSDGKVKTYKISDERKAYIEGVVKRAMSAGTPQSATKVSLKSTFKDRNLSAVAARHNKEARSYIQKAKRLLDELTRSRGGLF